MVQVEVEWVAPRGGVRAGQASQDGWRESFEQDAGNPVPEPHAMTFGGVVEQCGGQQVPVVMPGPEQALRHVDAVAAVRDRHRVEESHASFVQDPANERLLLRLDPRPHVGNELPDPMHRSAPD